MKNKNTIIYWIATGLFSAFMLLSGTMYFFQNQMVVEAYVALGYPPYLIYPVGALKILGAVAILFRKSLFLKNLAYAGFFFLLTLGVSAHLNVSDGGYAGALVGLILVVISYIYERKVFGRPL